MGRHHRLILSHLPLPTAQDPIPAPVTMHCSLTLPCRPSNRGSYSLGLPKTLVKSDSPKSFSLVGVPAKLLVSLVVQPATAVIAIPHSLPHCSTHQYSFSVWPQNRLPASQVPRHHGLSMSWWSLQLVRTPLTQCVLAVFQIAAQQGRVLDDVQQQTTLDRWGGAFEARGTPGSSLSLRTACNDPCTPISAWWTLHGRGMF